MASIRKDLALDRKSQAFAGGLGEMLPFHGKGRFVEIFHIQVLEDVGAWHVAE